MSLYDEVDIAVSASGDLTMSSGKDFQLTSASGVLKQDITFRLRTNYDEFIPHPDCGADLDQLIGEQNNRETAVLGQKKIIHSLTYDGMIRNIDLYVKGVPIALDKIVYYVFVNDGITHINVTPDVVFSMMQGIKNIPGV